VYKIARRGAEVKNGTILEDTKGLLITAEDGSRYGSVFGVPTDTPFIYTIAPETTAKAEPRKRGRRKKSELETKQQNNKPIQKTVSEPVENATAPVTVQPPAPEPPELEIIMDEGSFRKWIKSRFLAMSNADNISSSEARLLMTPEYSRSTFGIKTPILREIESRSNLLEQRSVNGKHYLVYKDWVASLHKDRFAAWLRSMGNVTT